MRIIVILLMVALVTSNKCQTQIADLIVLSLKNKTQCMYEDK